MLHKLNVFPIASVCSEQADLHIQLMIRVSVCSHLLKAKRGPP